MYGNETTTRHALLLGGASLDVLTGGAALRARQQRALDAAYATAPYGLRCESEQHTRHSRRLP